MPLNFATSLQIVFFWVFFCLVTEKRSSQSAKYLAHCTVPAQFGSRSLQGTFSQELRRRKEGGKTYLSILLIFRTECLATETLDEFPCWLSRAEGQVPGIKQQRTAEWSEMISEFAISYLNYLIDLTTTQF